MYRQLRIPSQQHLLILQEQGEQASPPQQCIRPVQPRQNYAKAPLYCMSNKYAFVMPTGKLVAYHHAVHVLFRLQINMSLQPAPRTNYLSSFYGLKSNQ